MECALQAVNDTAAITTQRLTSTAGHLNPLGSVKLPDTMGLEEILMAYSMLSAGGKTERKSVADRLMSDCDPLPAAGAQGAKHHPTSPEDRNVHELGGSSPRSSMSSEQDREQKPILTPAVAIADGITSVMVHNLPKSVTQFSIEDELDRSGFSELFDFLYVPYNIRTMRICGYAFINLTTPDAAALLVSKWEQRMSICGETTDKPIFFSAAHEQGYEAHLQRLRDGAKRSLHDPRLRPILRRPCDKAHAVDVDMHSDPARARTAPVALEPLRIDPAPGLADPAYIQPQQPQLSPAFFKKMRATLRAAGDPTGISTT